MAHYVQYDRALLDRAMFPRKNYMQNQNIHIRCSKFIQI